MKQRSKLSIGFMYGMVLTLVALGLSGQPERGPGSRNAYRDGRQEPLELTYIANMGVTEQTPDDRNGV